MRESGLGLLYPARRVNTFTLAQLRDLDALVTSVATSAAIVTYTGATLTGVLGNPGPCIMRCPQLVTVTTAASVGTYVLAAITVTGTDETGAALTDTLTLTQANGSETLATTAAFFTVTSIVRPAQSNANGSFQFGVRDLVFSNANPCRQIRFGSAGDVQLGFVGGSGAPYIDTTPGTEGEQHAALIRRVYGDTTITTSGPVTVYL